MLKENRRLIESGGAIVVLRKNDKAPVDSNWNKVKRLSWDEAKARFPEGHANIGLRLGEPSRFGKLHPFGLDLDIRSSEPDHVAEAWAVVAELVPEFGSLARSISGRGNGSCHLFGGCKEPVRTKKLRHSKYEITERDGTKRPAWELDLGGTDRQFLLPPSIHPISRKPYRWADGRPPDWNELVEFDADRIRSWSPKDDLTPRQREAAADELMAYWRERGTDLSPEDVADTLHRVFRVKALRTKYIQERDGWVRLGMMLHHEFKGLEQGYEIWCQFAIESEKFEDEDSWRVWKSFGRYTGPRLTFRTMIREDKNAQFAIDTGADTTNKSALPQDNDFGLHAQHERLDRVRQAEPDRSYEDSGDNPTPFPPGFETILEHLQDDDEEEKEAHALDWMTELHRNLTDNSIKHTFHNIGLIIEHDARLKGHIAKNLFTGNVVRVKAIQPLTANIVYRPVEDTIMGDRWSDVDTNTLRFFLNAPDGGTLRKESRGYGMKVSKADIEDVVAKCAEKNTFHPVRDYYKRLQWDGKPRIKDLFHRYFGCPDDAYHTDVARLMLVGAVARVFEPGCKFDFCAVLEGEQGTCKTTFIKALAVQPRWFGSLGSDFSRQKEMVEQMKGKTVLEIGELASFNKTSVESVKNFMSTDTDSGVRLAWARNPEDYARQCVFWGSTNDKRYLKSESGNRRFFPVVVLKVIDIDAFRLELLQIHAEAYEAYQALRLKRPRRVFGDLPLYLQGEAAATAALQLQGERKSESAVDLNMAVISAFLDEPITLARAKGKESPHGNEEKLDDIAKDYVWTKICAAQIYALCPEFHSRQRNSNEVAAIGEALRHLGWEGGSFHFPGYPIKMRGYRRPNAGVDEQRAGYMRKDRL